MTNRTTGSDAGSVRPAFRKLLAHYATYQLAGAVAGSFIGAYLLESGLSLPAALNAYAALLMLRFLLRFFTLGVVRRIGARGALALGLAISTLQYIPLCYADRPLGLCAWVATVSLSDSLYWPSYHATAAVTGGGEYRGREVGLRTAVCSVIGVFGPLLGGFLLAFSGAKLDFGLGATLNLVAAVSALRLVKVDIGAIPTIRDSLRDIDFSGVQAFASDGWLAAGLTIAWPMILYQSLGSRWQAFGIAGAIAGLAGGAASLLCGGAIDRGDRNRWLTIVSWSLAATVLLRVASSRSAFAAEIANALGAAVLCLYIPVLMTGVYERAKHTGAAYRFHFAAEAGWDVGGSLGCLAGAAAAWISGVPALAVLPCGLAIFALWACVRRHDAQGMERRPATSGGISWPEAPHV